MQGKTKNGKPQTTKCSFNDDWADMTSDSQDEELRNTKVKEDKSKPSSNEVDSKLSKDNKFPRNTPNKALNFSRSYAQRTSKSSINDFYSNKNSNRQHFPNHAGGNEDYQDKLYNKSNNVFQAGSPDDSRDLRNRNTRTKVNDVSATSKFNFDTNKPNSHPVQSSKPLGEQVSNAEVKDEKNTKIIKPANSSIEKTLPNEEESHQQGGNQSDSESNGRSDNVPSGRNQQSLYANNGTNVNHTGSAINQSAGIPRMLYHQINASQCNRVYHPMLPPDLNNLYVVNNEYNQIYSPSAQKGMPLHHVPYYQVNHVRGQNAFQNYMYPAPYYSYENVILDPNYIKKDMNRAYTVPNVMNCGDEKPEYSQMYNDGSCDHEMNSLNHGINYPSVQTNKKKLVSVLPTAMMSNYRSWLYEINNNIESKNFLFNDAEQESAVYNKIKTNPISQAQEAAEPKPNSFKNVNKDQKETATKTVS